MDGASIQSLTTGNGSGGNISITAALDGGPTSSTAGSVQMTGGQIQTASVGPGTVGDIQINSGSLSMTDGALIDTLLVPNPLIPGQPGGGTIAITATDSIFVTGQRPGTTNLLPSVPGLPTFTNMPSGIYSENFSANTGSGIVIQTPEPDPPAWSHWLSCLRCRRCRRPVLFPWAVDAQRRGTDWQQCVRGRGHWERTNQGIRLNHHVRFPSWDLPARTVGFAKC